MTIPLRLLLVEDSENDAMLLIRELKKDNFNVIFQRVDTRDDMRHALVTDSWDIVITDHNMPSFDSTHAISLIKDSGLDLPVIIVSGSMGEDIAVEAMKSGAVDYIMKGNLSRLAPAIERELREAESRKARRRAEQTIIHMAYHDALTGLSNRNDFEHRLKDILVSAKQRHIQHALLYIDLDQFKVINDTCGHVAGDELLRQLSVLLNKKVRETDTLARLGGDEFGVLLVDCPIDKAIEIADNILKTIKDFRFSWHEKSFTIGASIGLVNIGEHSRNVSEVMSAADIACYTAKDFGRNRVHVYKDDDKELLRRHGEMQWVTRIRQAIENNDFVLYRQNMLEMSHPEKECLCFEFLVRMKDTANNDVIPPGAFIPAAERYNLMPDLDRWVINTAFRYLAQTDNTTHNQTSAMTAFINLSGASLSDDNFFDYIRERLQYYQINPRTVCFEITETAAITNLRVAVEFIQEIKEQGCYFALDDFGSGLSSFTYLKHIPVDYLKIDGSFVRNMLYDEMDDAFVVAINQIGQVAGLKTIAEFVENEETLNRLKQIGVTYGQGYGIHLPEQIQFNDDNTMHPQVSNNHKTA